MNKATIEQVREALEAARGYCRDMRTSCLVENALAALSSAESEPTHSDVSQDGGNGDVKPLWKFGNEYAPYHPSASHVSPEYRDGWNACYAASQPYVEGVKPLWEELAEIGQEAASKGAFQSEVPALTALREVREALQFANDTPNGPISDTIWMMHRPETMFDYIDSVLSAPVRAAVEPNDDPAILWARIHQLEAEAKGPDGFATWKDAAVAERVRRVKAERKASPDAQAIRDAAQALVDKIQQVNADPAYINVFFTAQLHGGKYDGPNYAEELAHLEGALKSQAPQPAQECEHDWYATNSNMEVNNFYCEKCGETKSSPRMPSQVKDAHPYLAGDMDTVRRALEADEQEAFEVWVRAYPDKLGRDFADREKDGSYKYEWTESNWQAWQAAIAQSPELEDAIAAARWYVRDEECTPRQAMARLAAEIERLQAQPQQGETK